MEQRLIDANALKRAFCNHCDGDEPCTEPCVDIGLIETAPTVDAVPVVRCKDCKHYRPITETSGICYHVDTDQKMHMDWFCADGERKDGEHEQ